MKQAGDFCTSFFFFFPQFCGIKQTFGEVLKKLAKSVKFSVFFFKTIFSRKKKYNYQGKNTIFLFWVCQDPRKKKKKKLFEFSKFISLKLMLKNLVQQWPRKSSHQSSLKRHSS
jgi:hypothetical protein